MAGLQIGDLWAPAGCKDYKIQLQMDYYRMFKDS